MNKFKNTGFTLIELMIVVAIVAILASIAYPAYTSSIIKGKRAEGRAAVTELIQQQERYLTQRNTYLAFTNSGGVTNPTPVPFKTFSGDNAVSPAYFLSAEACPVGTATLALNDCIRVVATPTRADPAAGNLQLTSTGTRDCSVTGTMVCWK